jgi:hypothetical protein
MSNVNRYLVVVFLCCFIITGRSFSQAKLNLPKTFAYSREILRGVRPSIIADENGNTSERVAKPSLQYSIYIEAAATPVPIIKSVWVKGRSFSFTKEKISTPVLIQNGTLPDKATDTLIAFTKKTVWQLQLKDEKKESKKAGSLNRLTGKNAIVIEYTCNGKAYLLTVKEIKKLPAITLQ